MPNTPNMDREPALTIGEIFSKKKLIQPAIAAAVAIIAGIFNLAIGDAMVDNLTTVVMFAAMIWAALGANREQKQLATKQAEETREAVYAPATTKRLVQEASVTGDATIPKPPGSDKSGKK